MRLRLPSVKNNVVVGKIIIIIKPFDFDESSLNKNKSFLYF